MSDRGPRACCRSAEKAARPPVPGHSAVIRKAVNEFVTD